MTEENYNYRTSPLFLRNQFEGTGFLKIPTIPKPKLSQEDLQDLLLIGFDKARADDMIHQSRMVHFSYMTTNLSVFGKIPMLI